MGCCKTRTWAKSYDPSGEICCGNRVIAKSGDVSHSSIFPNKWFLNEHFWFQIFSTNALCILTGQKKSKRLIRGTFWKENSCLHGSNAQKKCIRVAVLYQPVVRHPDSIGQPFTKMKSHMIFTMDSNLSCTYIYYNKSPKLRKCSFVTLNIIRMELPFKRSEFHEEKFMSRGFMSQFRSGWKFHICISKWNRANIKPI